MPVLLNVLVTLMAVSFVVVAAGGFRLYRSFQQQVGNRASWYVADEYTDHLQTGNWTAAYDQTCAATRRSMTVREFTAAQQAGPEGTAYGVTGTSQDSDDGRTMIVTLRITAVDGTVRTRELPLVKEDGEWRPCP
jgi:hypothetical protein